VAAAYAFIIVAGVAVWFLPYFVARRRRHPAETGIFVLTLLTGVTVVGWVVAFVWAYQGGTDPKRRPHPGEQRACPHCGVWKQIPPGARLTRCDNCGHEFPTPPNHPTVNPSVSAAAKPERIAIAHARQPVAHAPQAASAAPVRRGDDDDFDRIIKDELRRR
jgi:hypothetical protein